MELHSDILTLLHSVINHNNTIIYCNGYNIHVQCCLKLYNTLNNTIILNVYVTHSDHPPQIDVVVLAKIKTNSHATIEKDNEFQQSTNILEFTCKKKHLIKQLEEYFKHLFPFQGKQIKNILNIIDLTHYEHVVFQNKLFQLYLILKNYIPSIKMMNPYVFNEPICYCCDDNCFDKISFYNENDIKYTISYDSNNGYLATVKYCMEINDHLTSTSFDKIMCFISYYFYDDS